MPCPKCGFDQDAYECTLEPMFEKTYDDLLPSLRRKAKCKGVFIGIFVISCLMLLPSSPTSPRTSLWTQGLAFSSDPVLIGIFIFLTIVGAVFGFLLAYSRKEEKLWRGYIAQKMKQLE